MSLPSTFSWELLTKLRSGWRPLRSFRWRANGWKKSRRLRLDDTSFLVSTAMRFSLEWTRESLL